MAVGGEPVSGQAPQTQAEHARGEVRRAGGGRQQQEARVVDDHEQARAAPAELAEAEVVVRPLKRGTSSGRTTRTCTARNGIGSSATARVMAQTDPLCPVLSPGPATTRNYISEQ